MQPPRPFFDLATVFGRDPLLCQAGGGNISVKVTPELMAVKTSGSRMSDLRANRHWKWVNRPELLRQLIKINKQPKRSHEPLYADVLKTASGTIGSLVSMEAGFHTVLPQRYVLHVHSAVGILLGLLPRAAAKKKIKTLFGRAVDVVWVPPCMPGYELTQFVLKHSPKPRSVSRSSVTLWVLQNHGLIWTSNDPSSLKQRAMTFERQLRQQWRLQHFPWPKVKDLGQKSYSASFKSWPALNIERRPLFPDSAVYFDLRRNHMQPIDTDGVYSLRFKASSARHAYDRGQILCFQILVATLAHGLNCFKPFPAKLASQIKNLQMEKHRIALSAGNNS